MDAPVRTIALWCPDWPIVAAGTDPTVPAAVLRANRVIARTPAAAAEGITIGLRRRQAQRRCPHLELLPHSPDLDAEAFEPVIRAVGEFTPGLEVLEPGRLHLGARGPARYFGGEPALARNLLDAALRAALETGPSARIALGIADGRFAADLAARLTPDGADDPEAPNLTAGPATGRGTADPARSGPIATDRTRTIDRSILIVESGATPAFLRPHPIERLAHLGELAVETVELLTRLGLTRMGDLADLDPADVLARFGAPGLHAHRLASGTDDRGPDSAPPPEPVETSIELDGPVGRLEPLVFTAKTLADDLTAALAGNGRVCTRLTVTAATDHGETDRRTWHRADGLDAASMVERVRWQLAGWLDRGGPTAGITRLHLEAIEVRGADGSQGTLWGGTSELDDRAVRAVARLTTLVGDHAVLVPAWRGGRLPAERCDWVPAAALDLLDHRETAGRLGPLAEPTRSIPEADPGSPRDPAGGGDGREGNPPRSEPIVGGRRRTRSRSRRRDDPLTAPWPGSLPTPAPTVVLPEPEPAVLTNDDGRPLRVTGRGELDGEPVLFAVGDRAPQIVTAWAGPWLVDERWWEAARRRRLARLQILCENDTAYLIAIEGQRWWLLASYR